MCGIVGIWRRDGAPIDPSQLRAMTDRLVHRGPDDEGYWSKPGVALGHRRLSIIDLAGSRQPMSAGFTHVCFNGEIFNYAELRSEIRGRYAFRTQGDTEVLLALYQLEGPDGVHRLDGQFAYAIVDEERDELWLFRDRIGILPLYYYWDGDLLLFASEIKAILPALPRPVEVDEQSVKEYLAYRSVPPPHTLFKSIRKLPPGHRICLTRTGGLRIEAYWTLPAAPPEDSISDAEAIELTGAALDRAVRTRLVADVPVGAYLSGGVDSSLIVQIMSRLRAGGETIETFSAGFDDPRFSELPYARQVSEQLGTRHHEIVVTARDLEDLWHRLTWHRDTPLSEPADLAVFKLAEMARARVKVLLSGEGSDELFGGYPKYRFARWAALASALPPALRTSLLTAIERRLPARAARLRIMVRAMSAPSEADRFQTWFAPFTSYERDALMPGVERRGHQAIWERATGDLLQRMLYFDCHTWLVDNLLERGDRMAMAASVESRPPFLDHHLVELAFRLPSRVKLRGGETKWVVKALARKALPAEIVDRRKVGFQLPLASWFRGNLRDMARDLLLSRDSFVGNLMDRKRIESLLQRHDSGQRDEEARIWPLVGLEVWHDVFFKGIRVPDQTTRPRCGDRPDARPRDLDHRE